VDKGRDLIQEALKSEPDAIVSDINLKDNINGIEAVQKILKKRRIPVIIISSFNDEITKKAVKELHPCAFIRKPCSAKEINLVLSECLLKAS
jgi:DNA-binding NarL/FixJ family response regulator